MSRWCSDDLLHVLRTHVSLYLFEAVAIDSIRRSSQPEDGHEPSEQAGEQPQ